MTLFIQSASLHRIMIRQELVACLGLTNRTLMQTAKQNQYSINIDYYSKWQDEVQIAELSAKYVIVSLKLYFFKYGLIYKNRSKYVLRDFNALTKEYGEGKMLSISCINNQMTSRNKKCKLLKNRWIPGEINSANC